MSEKIATDIDWTTEGYLDFLCVQWNSGLSTMRIAEECSHKFRQFVSKNAVVGKVGRMSKLEARWPRRSSPIVCRPNKPAAPPKIKLHGSNATLPPLPSILHVPATKTSTTPQPTVPWVYSTSGGPPLTVNRLPLPLLRPALAHCEARKPDVPLRRRDGTGCLFPIGDPRARSFKFCDKDIYHLAQPYCTDCAGVAYKPKRISADAQ